MYDTYIETWTKYSKQYGEQTALFYMVGKFYEMYDILNKQTGEGQTNVRQAVETLGITLTVREKDGPKGEDCLFAGFPEQSLQKFAAMLTRDGWTVVVCDQEKDHSGKVRGRPVARIFSPGTHIEFAGTDAPYLAGIWFEEKSDDAPHYAAAVLDMTTGHLVSFESKCSGGPDIWSSDELVHFFQIHSPRETVIWWRGAAFARPNEAIFRRRCGLQKGSVHLESASPDKQGTLEHPMVRKGFLEGIFSKKLGLLPIHEQLQIRTKPLTERILVCLLHFAEEHLPSALQNLDEHMSWTPESSVYMGNSTLTQLNYVGTGSEQSILTLFQKCLTSLGKRAMRERLLTPSSDMKTIECRLQLVDYFYSASSETIKKVEGLLRMIHDIARIHRKISMYTVTPADILALDQSYGCISLLDEALQKTVLDWGTEARESWTHYKTLFEESFDITKTKQALKEEDISFLPKSKAPKTSDVEENLAHMKQRVEECLEKIRLWVGLPPDAIRIEHQETSDRKSVV
jgi:DNA mismatch repair protein MutS